MRSPTWIRPRVLRASLAAVSAIRAELLVAGAILVGWCALTVGVASLLPARGARAVWPLSLGLFLFSACGWRFLGTVASTGLYALTRDERDNHRGES